MQKFQHYFQRREITYKYRTRIVFFQILFVGFFRFAAKYDFLNIPLLECDVL